eukprot:CAMPEP_0175058778 /NCGR_PEP_ID=MMETSP0052_2-20121109/12047_1 /TAXON_ID=51329 ORGANISM="Polytomella parva, Strain SAG 63-3" /NCGR_SAMPLE_ID=MMETSP0052_2 /ASSEMBLY_ACC=CAM_ASM_000194 /LENGTH=76 /DNA_ID=CAMNT_0016324217 /DNA_START=49 /DNA_END=275 /DNA_ORIENTATION=+
MHEKEMVGLYNGQGKMEATPISAGDSDLKRRQGSEEVDEKFEGNYGSSKALLPPQSMGGGGTTTTWVAEPTQRLGA